jgi:pimeloyl-ACP methyl ester carboxylesterase
MERRTLILGSAAVVGCAALGVAGVYELAEHGVIPGKGVIDRHLGRCNAAVPAIPAGLPASTRVDGAFPSVRRGRSVGYQIAYPPGFGTDAKLPVAILLHGFGGTALAELEGSRYPDYLTMAIQAGTRPYALAAVDGGGGYWHPHPGDDPLGMIFEEFLPLLGARGLSIDRPAVLGTSMGGFGAMLCGLTQPGRFAAVVASSPAFWRSYAEARSVNPGSFESAADWAQYGDMMSRAADLSRLPLHIYVGRSDPFEPAIAALRDRLADPSVVAISTGCHDNSLWRHYAPEQLRLIGAALANA